MLSRSPQCQQLEAAARRNAPERSKPARTCGASNRLCRLLRELPARHIPWQVPYSGTLDPREVLWFVRDALSACNRTSKARALVAEAPFRSLCLCGWLASQCPPSPDRKTGAVVGQRYDFSDAGGDPAAGVVDSARTGMASHRTSRSIRSSRKSWSHRGRSSAGSKATRGWSPPSGSEQGGHRHTNSSGPTTHPAGGRNVHHTQHIGSKKQAVKVDVGRSGATLGIVSTASVSRIVSVVEALAVFAIIMAYIWKLRFTHPAFWFPVVALILLSHVLHHERAQALGFQAKDFGNCVRRFGPALIGLALAILSAGLLFGTIRPIGFGQAMGSFALYLPWGLFQQYLMNGYFLKRFDVVLSQNAANVLTSGLFCAVHSPNWFLMLVTPVAGYGAVWVYRRYKNLYFLGLAHAMIGFLLFVAVPDSVSHHLNVGPGRSAPPLSSQAR